MQKNVKNYAKLLKTTTKFAVFEEKITKNRSKLAQKTRDFGAPLAKCCRSIAFAKPEMLTGGES